MILKLRVVQELVRGMAALGEAEVRRETPSLRRAHRALVLGRVVLLCVGRVGLARLGRLAAALHQYVPL